MDLLPLKIPVEQLETRKVLKQLVETRAALAELKGISKTIPNEQILIDTLTLQEAKESSAIENIVTTNDELYRSNYQANYFSSPEAKEVSTYSNAIITGYIESAQIGSITTNLILRIQEIIEQNNAGFRKLPGTILKNDLTGETIYEPPQHPDDIVELMDNLEWFINDPDAMDVDPLVKMAIIHHQFESIHPFYDGNGRTGRILNVLFLIKSGLLDLPILYISRYILKHRKNYYHLLQETRETDDWEHWIMYILSMVEITAHHTSSIIMKIDLLMFDFKQQIRNEQPSIYSQELLNNLFSHPYTKIALLQNDLKKSRPTATSYLNTLCRMGLLNKKKISGKVYYVNEQLVKLLVG